MGYLLMYSHDQFELLITLQIALNLCMLHLCSSQEYSHILVWFRHLHACSVCVTIVTSIQRTQARVSQLDLIRSSKLGEDIQLERILSPDLATCELFLTKSKEDTPDIQQSI